MTTNYQSNPNTRTRKTKYCRRMERSKNPKAIDPHQLEEVWGAIFVKTDYKTLFASIKETPQKVQQLRTSIRKSFKSQVIEKKIEKLLSDENTLKTEVNNYLMGITTNIDRFILRGPQLRKVR